MKKYTTEQWANGDSFTPVDRQWCSLCSKSYTDNTGMIVELQDDYICLSCVRSLFFKSYDVRSIPTLEECDGLLTYSTKGKGKRTTLPHEIREKVFRRDKYTCKHCQTKNRKLLTVDHIKPYSTGGKDVFSNFQTLCRSCNSKKGVRV